LKASAFIAASAAIILFLGLVHLLYTFRGPNLHPRDPDLTARMMSVSPVISQETTMWRAWVGFNATHSFGLILFGALYGYLAMRHSAFLLHSWFLLVLGFRTFAWLCGHRQVLFLHRALSRSRVGSGSLPSRNRRQLGTVEFQLTVAALVDEPNGDIPPTNSAPESLTWRSFTTARNVPLYQSAWRWRCH